MRSKARTGAIPSSFSPFSFDMVVYVMSGDAQRIVTVHFTYQAARG